ncbi:MAG: hypothetical protein BGO39_04995 [Chloroflexi bacterium 54-19]|nr:MAG: hypothetical protein BGO39_04995 [Chloroflexi bacterium 54-19]
MTTVATNQPNNQVAGARQPNLSVHPVAPQYRYNLASRRYVDAGGRFVSGERVRQAVDQVVVRSNDQIQTTSRRLQSGEISLAQWQSQMMQQMKVLHVANGLAGLGGSKLASQADYGYIGQLVKQQYQYLNQFAKDIATGVQLLDKSFPSRVKLYAEAARGTYHSVQTRAERLAGRTQAKRVLGPADHCPGCVEQAGKGWQPIEEVAPIGSQQCLTNCHCSIEFE